MKRRFATRAQEPLKPGKYLLFASLRNIDEVWTKVKKATEDGLLGAHSKVSTHHRLQLLQNPTGAVICVYVDGNDNKAERLRIHKNLVDMGFPASMPFKPDEATLRGEYSKKIAKGRERAKAVLKKEKH